MDTAIQEAIELVGTDDPDQNADWKIRPTDFPKLFPSEPEFSAFLGDTALTTTAEAFEEADARAVAAQKDFMVKAKRATMCVFAVTVSTALLASTAVLFSTGEGGRIEDPLGVGVVLGLTLMSVGFGICGVVLTHLIAGTGALKKWMSSRADAESGRMLYFSRVMERLKAEHSADTRLHLLGLELFRRYQLEVQENYYEGRAKQHEEQHRRFAVIGAWAAGILTVGSGLSGLAGLVHNADWLPLAALGAIGAGLATVASRYEDLTQAGRNAERYLRTRKALREVKVPLTGVRKGVSAGRTELVAQFVDAVHEQTSLEHRQWIDDSKAIYPAFRTLQDAVSAG